MARIKILLAYIFLLSFSLNGQNSNLKQVLSESRPIVCGHRGGYYTLYPENSIEITKFILNESGNKPVMVEIDLRSDKDGLIWLMHDTTLNRTTNGTGNIKLKSSDYVKQLKLKTQDGLITNINPVSFEEFLQFSVNKPIFLMLDIKDKSLYSRVDGLLSKYKMSDRSLILTFSDNDTKEALNQTQNVLISALVSTYREYYDFEQLKANHKRMFAYVTDATPDSIINHLKILNIALISDLRELWKNKFVPETSVFYHTFIRKKQLDILVTDFPVEVTNMLDQNSELSVNIQNIHLQKFKWFIEKNTDSLSTLLHENVHYIHSNGWKETKQELIHNIKSGKLTYHSVTVHESDVRIEGNTAIVTGKGIFNVALDGKGMEIPLYYTEVYVLSQSGIRLLSRHACRIL